MRGYVDVFKEPLEGSKIYRYWYLSISYFYTNVYFLNHAVCYVFLILRLLQIKFVPQISCPHFAANGTRSFNLSTRNKRGVEVRLRPLGQTGQAECRRCDMRHGLSYLSCVIFHSCYYASTRFNVALYFRLLCGSIQLM